MFNQQDAGANSRSNEASLGLALKANDPEESHPIGNAQAEAFRLLGADLRPSVGGTFMLSGKQVVPWDSSAVGSEKDTPQLALALAEAAGEKSADAPTPKKSNAVRCQEHAEKHLRDSADFKDYAANHKYESESLVAMQNAMLSGDMKGLNQAAQKLAGIISRSVTDNSNLTDGLREALPLIQKNILAYDGALNLGLDLTDDNTILLSFAFVDKNHAVEINRDNPKVRSINISEDGFVTLNYDQIVKPTAADYLKEKISSNLIGNIYYSDLTGFSNK